MSRRDSVISPEELYAVAERARELAYAPYSGFAVGAAVVVRNGEIFTGVNIENASYSLAICAERVAVFNALASGHQDVVAIAIAGSVDTVTPCGACRQVLAEFGRDDMRVTFGCDGRLVTKALGELLPNAFRLVH